MATHEVNPGSCNCSVCSHAGAGYLQQLGQTAAEAFAVAYAESFPDDRGPAPANPVLPRTIDDGNGARLGGGPHAGWRVVNDTDEPITFGTPAPECTCDPAPQDAGGGYTEYLLEPNPDCPVHFPAATCDCDLPAEPNAEPGSCPVHPDPSPYDTAARTLFEKEHPERLWLSVGEVERRHWTAAAEALIQPVVDFMNRLVLPAPGATKTVTYGVRVQPGGPVTDLVPAARSAEEAVDRVARRRSPEQRQRYVNPSAWDNATVVRITTIEEDL